jgi:peptidoglycan hydrolase FlgJ
MELKKIAAQSSLSKNIWSVDNKGVLVSGEQKATFEKLSKKDSLSPEEDAKLKKACKDFESFFVYYLLKQMRASIPKDEGILEASHAQEIYQDMFDERVSDKIASSKGMGLGAMLYKQVKNSLLNAVDPKTIDKKG